MAEKRKSNAGNSALVGAGATTAGVGAIAGGVPGVKSNTGEIMRRVAERKKAKTVGESAPKYGAKNNAKVAAQAGRGGILGFRVSNHEAGTYGFKQKATMGEWYPSNEPAKAFKQGRDKGKVAPEEKIIRQMKGGRKVANAALIGGVGAMGYGAYKSRQNRPGKIGKRDDRKRNDRARNASGAAVGAGGAAFGVAQGAGSLLGNQEKKWYRVRNDSNAAAARLAPNTKGKNDLDIARGGKKVFEGVSADNARKAGVHRGTAIQANHFAHVYGGTGKVVRSVRTPAAALAGAGGAGLVMTKPKSKVRKSTTSAFGVDHA